MAVLNPVFGPAADLLLFLAAKSGHSGLVGSESVGGDRIDLAMPLQLLLHEGQSGSFIAGSRLLRRRSSSSGVGTTAIEHPPADGCKIVASGQLDRST